MTAPLRALVTGAGQRLGQAIALALGQRQAHVVVHYHQSQEGALSTAERIRSCGGRADLEQADLSRASEARALAERSVEILGGLDLLVSSAANFERIPYERLDDAALDRALGLNLAGPFALAHQASPALRASRGNIVFITCASATAPYENYLPYTVSKAALRHLMRTMSLELAPDVRVNAVAPGTVLPPTSYGAAAIDKLARAVPLQRIGSPDDIVRAVLYLHDSPFVTGQELVVDGGRA